MHQYRRCGFASEVISHGVFKGIVTTESRMTYITDAPIRQQGHFAVTGIGRADTDDAQPPSSDRIDPPTKLRKYTSLRLFVIVLAIRTLYMTDGC